MVVAKRLSMIEVGAIVGNIGLLAAIMMALVT
jgi:hypothetical protein